MAICNIEKYDTLPARIELTDVDYLRYCFSNVKKKLDKLTREQNKILFELEIAYKKSLKYKNDE